MNNKEILLEANKYIEDNKIDKNTYQVEKAFIDGANMAFSKVKNLNSINKGEAEQLGCVGCVWEHAEMRAVTCRKCIGGNQRIQS